MTAKVSARDRRLNAIGEVANRAFYAGYAAPEDSEESAREYWAGQIAPLRTMGKTERWVLAIDTWVDMVSREENPLDWAMLQYSVFANYAA